MYKFGYEDFEGQLDELLELRDKCTRRQIDAGACGTDRDYRRATEAEDSFRDAQQAFVAHWVLSEAWLHR